MTLEIIDGIFSVCKLEKLPSALPDTNFIFFARTDSEISLVCPTDFVPGGILRREDGWRALRVCGELDFSLVGILADITSVLARRGISIFAGSTYDTDYILIKENNFADAISVLGESGYTVEENKGVLTE